MAAASMRTWSVVVAALGGVALLGGCGSDSGDVSGVVSSTATLSSAVAASSPTDTPTSTNPSAEAVPGPRLPSATSVPPSKEAPTIDGARCDTVNGPDGALRVVVFPGGSADCGTVMPVARTFGPLISTGRNQDVDGWSCGPSQTTGVLAKCTKGSNSFGFVPQ
jgi:hypothetical protein